MAFEPDPIRTLFLSKCGNPTGNAPKETKPAANTQPGKSRRPHIRPGCLQQATEHAPPLGHIPASAVLNNKHCFHRETPSKSRKPLPLQFERLLPFSTAQNVLGPSRAALAEAGSSLGARQPFPRHLGDGGKRRHLQGCSVPSPLSQWPLARHRGTLDSPRPLRPPPCRRRGHHRGRERVTLPGAGGTREGRQLEPGCQKDSKASEEQGKGAAEGCPRPFRHPEARQVCLLGEEARPSRRRGDRRAA